MKKKNKGFLGAAGPILVALFAWGINYLDTNQEQTNHSNTTTTEISNSTVNQDVVNLDYDGTNKVVIINNNQPNFSQEDISLANGSWQTFSDLDNLNRVGVANALLGYDLMPTGERGDISSILQVGSRKSYLMGNGYIIVVICWATN